MVHELLWISIGFHTCNGNITETKQYLSKKYRPLNRFKGRIYVGCGGWIWTNDLRVMSPTSYLAAPHRDIQISSTLILYHKIEKCETFFQFLMKFVSHFIWFTFLINSYFWTYKLVKIRKKFVTSTTSILIKTIAESTAVVIILCLLITCNNLLVLPFAPALITLFTSS